MKRRPTTPRSLRPLTVEALDDLPAPCRTCTFWEVAGAPRGPAGTTGRAAKRAWVEATTAAWGPPGRVVYLEGRPAAFALLVPGRFAGRVAACSHTPSDDALLLATMWVDPRARGAGLGRVLLQTVLRDVHERGGRAVEAYGARGPQRAGPCILDERFLLASGFTVLHEDPLLPLLRLDLRKTVRWQESLAEALGPVIGALARRRLAPAPAPAQLARMTE